MSWQEDLRRIDGDLAAGKLSKEQYALRREELLAEASSTPTPQTAQAPQQREPLELDVPPDVPVVTSPPVPAKDLLTTDRQTTAPSPADERSTDSMPHPKRPPSAAKPEPVRRGELPPPVPPRFEPPRAQPQRTAEPDPFVPPPAGPRRGGALLFAGVLVVVALIAGGLWWLTSDGGGETEQAAPPPTTTTEQPEASDPPSTGPSELADELPQLPGVLNRNSGTFSPAEGAERKLYGEDEAVLLKRQGVKSVTWKGSSRTAGDAQMAYVILVAENKSAAKAESTAKALRGLSSSRVPKVDGLKGYADLPTYRKLSKETNVYRVIYTSGTKTVRVGVVQTPGTDGKRLTSELSDLLGQITATLPASAR